MNGVNEISRDELKRSLINHFHYLMQINRDYERYVEMFEQVKSVEEARTISDEIGHLLETWERVRNDFNSIKGWLDDEERKRRK